jgi:hypothetical protein
MEMLGFDSRDKASLQALTEDIVKSSKIEGENLNSDQVRSSIARRLEIDTGGLVPAGRDIKDLITRGALAIDPGGGRTTSYSIIFGQS